LIQNTSSISSISPQQLMKVLIFSPYLDKPGGVAVYFSALKDHLDFESDFFFRGNPSIKKNYTVVIRYFIDYLRLTYLLIRKKHDIYLVNTSFAETGCKRDQVFLYLLKLLNKKVVVFFHGWNKEYQIETDKGNLENNYPLKAFKKADAIIVLASEFKKKLILWGFQQKIHIETTVVDPKLTANLEKNPGLIQHPEKNPFVFLFMARVEVEKGVFEAVDLFQLLQEELPQCKLRFVIAGDGSALSSLKEYVENKHIKNIDFLGHVSGEQKFEVFKDSHIFLFPTNHGEGMPICLLEAMAFGLPLLTTNVGGIKDFF
jgi:glycosyltransferase involved in cell wall biosynthesis